MTVYAYLYYNGNVYISKLIVLVGCVYIVICFKTYFPLNNKGNFCMFQIDKFKMNEH